MLNITVADFLSWMHENCEKKFHFIYSCLIGTNSFSICKRPSLLLAFATGFTKYQQMLNFEENPMRKMEWAFLIIIICNLCIEGSHYFRLRLAPLVISMIKNFLLRNLLARKKSKGK